MFRLGNQFTIGLVFVRRSSLDNHLTGSLVRGAFASQKPSSGTSFACGKSGPWRVSCPLYQHSSSAAGKQWLPQDGFVRCSLFLYLLFITLCKLQVYIYSISICYTSDTESLDEAVAQFVIEVIEFGYKLLFIHIPSPKVSRNNRSAFTGKTQWTLRDLNYVLIRLVDYDDYTIKGDVFAYIDEAWGPHTIDRFIIARNLLG